MKTYEFMLKFTLSEPSEDSANYISRLAQSGCDDALIGTGNKGRVALDFMRQAASASAAVISALKDVKKAIPQCRLIEASPDLLGLTDIAEIMNFSRQNMRKLALNNYATFPAPVHDGKISLWHLADVLCWFESERGIDVDMDLKEIAQANRQLNFARESSSLDPGFQAKVCQYL